MGLCRTGGGEIPIGKIIKRLPRFSKRNKMIAINWKIVFSFFFSEKERQPRKPPSNNKRCQFIRQQRNPKRKEKHNLSDKPDLT